MFSPKKLDEKVVDKRSNPYSVDTHLQAVFYYRS